LITSKVLRNFKNGVNRQQIIEQAPNKLQITTSLLATQIG